MSKYYKISPKFKKSVFDYQRFETEDKSISFTIEEMYRWGHVVIKVEEGEELSDIIGDPNDPYNEFEIDSYNYEDGEVDDGCSLYFMDCKGITEEELNEKYEKEGYDSILDNFGEPVDFYKLFHGELDIQDVTEQYKK